MSARVRPLKYVFGWLIAGMHACIIPHWKGSKEEMRLVRKLQPCVAYKPQARSIGLKVKLAAWKWFEKTELHIKYLTGKIAIGSDITAVRQANRSRFRTVWYSRFDRRK